jgi:hypothetical protein
MDRIIFIFILLLPCGLFAQNIDDILGKLSTSDRQSLEELFHILIDEDQFGYTLFGDKPVSLSGDFTVTPYEVTLSGIPSGGLFWKKWDIWKNIQKDLCITKYFFIKEPAFNRPDGMMSFLFLINKKAFLETVNQHIQTFRSILGQDVTSVKLLEKMEKEQAFMKPLKNSELLLGILLGYGKNNAQLYDRRMQLRKFITSKSMPILPEKKPQPSQGFSSIEEEVNFLNQQLRPFSSLDNGVPWMISPVQFAANPDYKETKLLKRKYACRRNEISRLYAESNDFLELIVLQLTAN